MATNTQWNLLTWLKAGLAVLVVADVIFLAVIINAHGQYDHILNTIGRDSAPSVIAAQKIKVFMADMDADAANELLAKPGEGTEATKAYEQQRTEAAKALVFAAKNITYDEEWKPIQDMQTGLGTYESLIQRARDFHERNDPKALQIYREASGFMSSDLFKAADLLAQVNLAELNKAFDEYADIASQMRLVVIGAALLLLGLLVFAQWEMTRRFRRLLNPGLLAATFLAFALLAFVSTRLSHSATNVKVAKSDAFDSLHALWQARAVAFAANADESKYLLPDNHQAEDEKSFFDRAKTNGTFLDKELANITFEGEKDAATATLAAWQQYLKIDTQIRRLNTNNRHDDALKLCLGSNVGESDWAFARFDDALVKTVAINQEAFDKAFTAGTGELKSLNVVAAVGTAGIAACFIFGLLIRIREFL